MSSNTKQFCNLSPATWACWQSHLVPYLESKGAQEVQFSGGNSGSLSLTFEYKHLFHTTLSFTYSYDGSSCLTLTITSEPLPDLEDTIFSRVESQIYTCPPA